MEFPKHWKVYLTICSIIFLIPVAAYIIKFWDGSFSNDPQDWGVLGDFFGGVLNSYIGTLNLVATFLIAVILSNHEKKLANESEKQRQVEQKEATERTNLLHRQSSISAIFDIYKYYSSPEFLDIRTTAWFILKRAASNSEYCDYLVNQSFVSRYINPIEDKAVYEKFREYLYTGNSRPTTRIPVGEYEFLKQEADDRSKLDNLINFYSILSKIDVPPYIGLVCDFNYDTWLPVLLWYSEELEKAYNRHPENFDFSNQPSLKTTINELNKKGYLTTKVLNPNINQNPVLVHMRKSSNY